jgi:thiol-disulfide isomerase/thioredoxin
MKINPVYLTTLFLIAIGMKLSAATENAPTLRVGDPAPKIQTGDFVQGAPVTNFENGKAYLVEFWATWCVPCRESIPHLNEIHQKYKDKNLVVIGQDCSERDEALVKPFVAKMGAKMTYRVALDDKKENKKGKMSETWMAAAGMTGIPNAFLVDTKGIIAWIGHPMNLKDEMIEQVLAANFDVQKAAAQYSERLNLDLKIRSIWSDFGVAMRDKKWDTAMAKVDEAESVLPAEQKKNMDAVRFNVMLEKKDYSAAYQFASRVSDSHKGDATLQNELAWRIATDSGIENRDLELAEKFAERANAASMGKVPGIIDTLARIKWLRGKKDEAISFQQTAINLTDDSTVKGKLQKVLDSYKRGELPKLD